MGAIGGEGMVKDEKMQGLSGGNEEKILVLVRLRPLNEKEIEENVAADWECINNTTVLYRNTLREGSTFPNSYSFDRVFRGDCSTREVYDEGVKEIALSVISGVNSSIFAYGQTSSGKTYTMTGITEYAVSEIFDYIYKHEERAFVMKFSAIEIYNEAIRDLLSTDNTQLRLRDDPEKGVTVEKVTEESLRDWSHFKELISICEAQRRIGETSLNEKSSRSHQIIKLTVESSAREFLGKDNSTTLSASVNFVDLAGSERASQALSAGSRLKEGCHINRSLLTLGTVIRKLSKGRNGHINYRDSKLTRILQPALGGNARTAIICTLSPARSHVEQTRNTLLFACCAKEVTTKAQVNIVMSDKALVKHLQRELARLETELKAPVPASSTCNCAASLKKKDLQIQKMEREIRELTKQRDLAQSRINDLLQLIGNDQESRQAEACGSTKQRAADLWDDEGSMSETSSVVDTAHGSANTRKHANHHYYGREYQYNNLQDSLESYTLSEVASSPVSPRRKYFSSDSHNDLKQTTEYCKELHCVNMEESHRDENHESFALSNGGNEEMSGDGDVMGSEIASSPVNVDSEASHVENGATYSTLQQNLQDIQKTTSPMTPIHFELPQAMDWSSSGSTKFTRSRSCRANIMNGLNSLDKAEKSESTPPNGSERKYAGRPESVRTRFPPLNYDANSVKLLRSDSQSSAGSACSQATKNAGDEMTSIHTFISGLKDAKLQYEKQLAIDQGEGNDELEKNVRDIGLDLMQEASRTPSDWPLEFERQQRAILELWQSCNVSLVHRTYFFLLFKGDPKDSIYLEVELRRLSFLKETFSRGTQAVQGGQALTLASSTRALRREREMLSKLMNRRLSEDERNEVYDKWGIRLRSKRRRMQLASLLWSNPKDMNQVNESASIVAKLLRFTEQGHALKEMFGLSFTPPGLNRKSLTWKRSMKSLT